MTSRRAVSARNTCPDCKCKWKGFSVVTDNSKVNTIGSLNEIANKEKQDIHLSGRISLFRDVGQKIGGE